MPALTATVSSTTEVKLDRKLRQKLTTGLQQYAQLSQQIKTLEATRKELVAKLGDLRDETGETSLKLEGLGTITLVASTYKKFSAKKFVALGGDLTVYNEAMEDRLKKPFNKITLPTDKDSDEGDE